MKRKSKILSRVISILLSLALCLQMQAGLELVSAEVPEGYKAISTRSQLLNIGKNMSGKYMLTNDIDISGAEWTPLGGLGDSVEAFSGIFDGNGYRIRGMEIQSYAGEDGTGLFASLGAGGEIKNLGLVDVDINVANDFVGGIVGSDDGYGARLDSYVENCYVTGTISSSHSYVRTGGDVGTAIGGIMGASTYTHVSNCYSAATISLKPAASTIKSYAGGIVGYIDDHDISFSYNVGQVTGELGTECGGILGYKGTGASVKSCYYLSGSGSTSYGSESSKSRMVQKASYFGFDFSNTWEIDPYCESYPYPQFKNNRQIRLTELKIIKTPDKTVYDQGDELDVTGGEVKLTYEDSSTKTISMKDNMVSGFDMSKIAEQSVAVEIGGKKDFFDITVKEIPVTEISISGNTALNKGDSMTLAASVSPQNASYPDVAWSIGQDSTGEVSIERQSASKLTVKGKKAGKVIINATAGTKLVEYEFFVLVPCQRITLSKEEASLEVGNEEQLTAELLPVDCTETVTWSSSDDSIATVVDGLVIAKGRGDVKITAETDGGETSICQVAVKENIANCTIDGLAEQTFHQEELQPKLIVRNGEEELVEGTDYTTEYFNNDKPGTGKVVVTGEGFYHGTKEVPFIIHAVSAESILIEGASHILNKDDTMKLSVNFNPADTYNKAITWSIDKPDVASISEEGIVKGKAVGNAEVTAVSENGKQDSYSLQILSPATYVSLDQKELELNVGEEKELKANYLPDDCTDSFSWLSSDENIATVVDGKILGKSLGDVIITYASSSGKEFSCQVTVKQPIDDYLVNGVQPVDYVDGEEALQKALSVTDGKLTLEEGKDYTVSYEDNTEPGLAKVVISGKGYYVGRIEKEFEVTVVEVTEVVISSEGKEIEKGNSISVTAEVYPPTASYRDIIWSIVSDESHQENGYIDQKGIITATGTGKIKVRATARNGIFQDYDVDVVSHCTKLSLNKSELSLEKGDSQMLTLTKLPVDMTDEIMWSSSDENVASVSNGTIYAEDIGVAEIKARSENGIFVVCNVTVTRDISEFMIQGIYDVTYQEKPVTQDIIVNDGNKILNEGTDYKVIYSNNDAPGIAEIVIQGIGYYTGEQKQTFQIKSGKGMPTGKPQVSAVLPETKIPSESLVPLATETPRRIEPSLVPEKSSVPEENNVPVESLVPLATETPRGIEPSFVPEKSSMSEENNVPVESLVPLATETPLVNRVSPSLDVPIESSTPTLSDNLSKSDSINTIDDLGIIDATDLSDNSEGSVKVQQTNAPQSSPMVTPDPDEEVIDIDEEEEIQLARSSFTSIKNIKNRKVKLSIKKITYADGYQVQIITNINKKSQVTTKKIKKRNVTLKGFQKKKIYYLRVRAYAKSSDGIIYGKWSPKYRIAIKR